MGMIIMGALILIIRGTRYTTAERIISNGKRIIIRLGSDKVEPEIIVFLPSRRRQSQQNESHVVVSLSLSLLATEDRTNLAGRPSYHSNLFTGADSYHCRRDSCRYRSDNLPFSFAGLGFNGGIRSDSLLLSITGASTRGMSVTVPRIESEVSFAACVGRKVWSFSFPRPTPLEDAIFIFLRGPGE